MEIYVNASKSFSVPATVADHFLGLATHDQLKVLLYVLRHREEALTDAEVARVCKVRPEAVEEALCFWQDVNVLQNIENTTVSCNVSVHSAPVRQRTQPTTSIAAPAAAEPEKPAAVAVTSANYPFMPSDVAARTKQNPQMAEMLEALQMLLGRIPSHTELRSIFWMHEYLGLAPDLLLMLIAFCMEIDCCNVLYVEKVALEWRERGITTHELADADITRRTQSRTFTGKIMHLFEMTRRPTPKQQVFIDEWQKNGISLELIEYAYHKGRDNKDDKLNFGYINGILKRWTESGAKTVAEADAADSAFYEKLRKQQPQQSASAQKNVQPKKETSYDLSEFEKLMNQF